MQVKLLVPWGSPETPEAPDPRWEDRFSDLNLEPIVKAMAGGDFLIETVCRSLLDTPLTAEAEILYRQDILRECLAMPDFIRKLYGICQQAEERRKSTWYRMTSPYLSTIYTSAGDLLRIYMETLVEIRKALEQQHFTSRGLQQLSLLLSRELSQEYLDQVRSLQYGIGDRDGILISAGFGPYLQGVSYVKRQPDQGLSRLRWLVQPSYTLADRDMNGAKDLEIRRNRAINEVANAMAQAAGSLQGFVDQLRKELGFYVGALNLHDRLTALGIPLCFPKPAPCRHFQNLCDGALALVTGKPVVGNSLEARGKLLYLITGANQGGKTTFLRSMGLAQLMAQCGLFVCGDEFEFPIRQQILTHFGREEDRKMDSGKLDEELTRMSALVELLKPGSMLLCNESFSSTNDRDGSEIFLGITRAFLEKGIEVFSVTHLMSYAQALASRQDTFCLRAQREETGERTYRLIPGKPLPTAFGEDIYRKVFS